MTSFGPGLHGVPRHLWRQRVLSTVSCANSRKRSEDVAQCVPKSNESDAGLPQFDARLCASLHEQVLVSGACNGAHSVKLRLARWLLMMDDRTDGNVLQITQTLLAEMLGVYRPTITNALREFEKSGPSCPRSTTDRGAQSKSSPASVLRMLPTGP